MLDTTENQIRRVNLSTQLSELLIVKPCDVFYNACVYNILVGSMHALTMMQCHAAATQAIRIVSNRCAWPSETVIKMRRPSPFQGLSHL